MDTKENLHAGHRARMIDKFLTTPDNFSDHELLEILLFFALPRIDTNALAHKILNVFGTIDKVFSASKKDLTAIKGVGERVATEIIVVGRILDRVRERKKVAEPVYSFLTLKTQLIEFFRDETLEKLVIVLLDKKHKKITQVVVEANSRFEVSVEVPEIAESFAKFKPSYVIIAHNHLSGSVEPSYQDDVTTKKINLLCTVHGANLIEHIIISKEKAYSYFKENRLDALKEKTDMQKILNEIR